MIIKLSSFGDPDPNHFLCIQCNKPGWDPDVGCVDCGLTHGVGVTYIRPKIKSCICGSGIPEYRCVKCQGDQ